MTSAANNIFEVISKAKQDGHHKRKVKHKLLNLQIETEEEKNKIFDLISWLDTNGDDIIGLVKIVMNIVNSEEIGGAYKKREARILFSEILELMDVGKEGMDFYLKLFDSGVEVIIWAKKGGLTKFTEGGGCFPCRKKKSVKKKK